MNIFAYVLKRKQDIDYTHWDIHALARIIDPVAWAEVDALPAVDPVTGRKKYYGDYKSINQSFDISIRLLKAGIMATKHHLWSEAALLKYLENKK